MHNPYIGAKYLLIGLSLLLRPGVRVYFIVPFIVNVLIFTALIVLGLNYFGGLVNALLAWLPWWLQWLSWLLWGLFATGLIMLAVFSFSFVANLVGAPFNGFLAAAVEYHLTGRQPSDSSLNGQSLVQVIMSSLANELKKILYALAWSLPLLLLFVVPVVQLVAPLVWAIFIAWMLAVEYVDYPLANNGLNFKAVRRALADRRTTSLGFGFAVLGATMLPLLNLLVMPAAVAGATVYWVRQIKQPE